MGELKESFLAIFGAMAEVRPVVRPYLNGALIIVLAIKIAWDLHPEWGSEHWPWWSSALTYTVAAVYFIFDGWIQWKIRQRQAEQD